MGMSNIHDIMFAHNVYIATRKWRVLKVTLQVATPGVESAVYNCLVFVAAITLKMHFLFFKPPAVKNSADTNTHTCARLMALCRGLPVPER